MIERALKAYKNLEFLNSREARAIRISSEYIEPETRFERMNVLHTVVFFGSSRIRPDEGTKTGEYYWAAEELAYMLSKWAKEMEKEGNGFFVCTGGGPGIMEAANRGAERANAKSIGLNISLPFEQFPNQHISPELNFEFHYFFMRKLWFLYHAKAIVVFPGGFGTLDELFETLTLVQTGKLEKRNIPVLLYDREYWESLINFDKLVEFGMISPEDLDLVNYFSNPKEGFDLLKPEMEKLIEEFINNYI